MAVLLVVVFHAFPAVLPGGFVGVDVFFVISGFLITGIIARAQATARFSLRSFYGRRIRRIFPALLLVLLASMVGGYFFLLPTEFAQLGKHLAASTAFVPNLMFWSEAGYFDKLAETKPLLHLWSLGVEEQFYIVWPGLLVLALRWRAGLIAIGLLMALSFALNVAIVVEHPNAAFYSPFSRFWELMIGGALALKPGLARRPSKNFSAIVKNVASLAGFVCILAPALLLHGDSVFPGWWALLPTVGTVLFIWAGPAALTNRALSVRVAVWVGLISYPLYLWHWPLLSFAFIVNSSEPPQTTRLVAVAASLALALATYQFVERPVRFGRRKARDIVILVSVMAFVGVAGLTVWLNGGFAGRFPQMIRSVLAYQSYQFAEDARYPDCWLSNERSFSEYDSGCFLANPGSPQSVVLWGDSHAARLYPGLKAVMANPLDLAELTRNSCAPLLGYGYPACQEGNDAILRQIRKSRPAAVVLFAAWANYESGWSSDSAIARALEKTIDEVKATGVDRVIVIGPFPKWKADLPPLLYRRWATQRSAVLPARLADAVDLSVRNVDGRMAELVRRNGADYFSLANDLCNPQGCMTYVPGHPDELLTWDNSHLTTPGATFVAGQLHAAGLLP